MNNKQLATLREKISSLHLEVAMELSRKYEAGTKKEIRKAGRHLIYAIGNLERADCLRATDEARARR